MTSDETRVLFLGGRSGVGKSTVAFELSRQLEAVGVAHALIEGDNLDQAFPQPWRNGTPMAERNLAAMWGNYRDAGYTRLIYTNTVSVLEIDELVAAIGGAVQPTDGLSATEVATAVLGVTGWAE